VPRRRSRDAFAGDQRLGALHAFDAMAALDSPVHRLDPRAKLLATFAFIVVVMSFDRYELRALLPFALYPVALFGLAGLPARPILLTMLLASPFAVMVGLANPIFDRAPIASAMGFEISGGWVSFASVLVRFALTVGAALLLVATTGMYRVCMALERLLVPRIFVLQLLFVYRYVFVLADEAASISRAVRLRSFGQPTTIALFGRLAGALLLRTLDRAQRIHRAMVARGFDGRIRFLGNLTLRPADAAFLVATTAAFAALRSIDGPALLGRLLLGGRT
jgi:cobalt/nickel transport system permease protein